MDEKKLKQLSVNQKLIQMNNPEKVAGEDKTRKQILHLARLQGCEKEVIEVFYKYDKLLYNCTNEIERKHISINGIVELHKLLNVQGGLNIDGVELLPPIGKIKEVIV